jgi:hypothetical protein
MELITWVVPVAGLAAVAFALYLARDVMSRDTGTARVPTRSSGASTRRSPSSPSSEP